VRVEAKDENQDVSKSQMRWEAEQAEEDDVERECCQNSPERHDGTGQSGILRTIKWRMPVEGEEDKGRRARLHAMRVK
jgi:hypothetical protein